MPASRAACKAAIAALCAAATIAPATQGRASAGIEASWTQLMDQCIAYIDGEEIAPGAIGPEIENGFGPDGIERRVHAGPHDLRLRFGASDVAVPKNARHCLVWTKDAMPTEALEALHAATMARYDELIAEGWTLGDFTFDDAPYLEKDIHERRPSGCLAASRINIEWAPGTASFYARLIGMNCATTTTDKG
ncbi:hypothetical protein [Roseivivax lentus]|nr:hypothetical protein [Roseivivax lentus]